MARKLDPWMKKRWRDTDPDDEALWCKDFDRLQDLGEPGDWRLFVDLPCRQCGRRGLAAVTPREPWHAQRVPEFQPGMRLRYVEDLSPDGHRYRATRLVSEPPLSPGAWTTAYCERCNLSTTWPIDIGEAHTVARPHLWREMAEEGVHYDSIPLWSLASRWRLPI